MNTKIQRRIGGTFGVLLAAGTPAVAYAQENIDLLHRVPGVQGMNAFTLSFLFVAFLILIAILTKVWMGIVNVSLIDSEPLSSIEARHPYLPSVGMVIGGLCATGLLVYVSLRTLGWIAPFEGATGQLRGLMLLGGLSFVMGMLLLFWNHGKEYVFACVLGTVTSFILIAFARSLLTGGALRDPLSMTMAVIAIVLVWRFLFGPWEAHVKAAVLGTFIFWVAVHIISQESGEQQLAHAIAIALAAVPAVVWCALFLPYHKERLSVVFLMFFSGMLSTMPVLFYDALVRHNVELQFFVFKIVPQSFNETVHTAVGNISGLGELQASLFSLFVSFIFVGILEEGSKFWVLHKNGTRYFSSIDDAIQLAILAAIGFAFAENITNSGYFLSFVREYLLNGGKVDWGSFLGNIAGRSILTSMVHIVSTGVMGYFYGLAVFVDSKEESRHPIGGIIHWLFGSERRTSYRTEMMIVGVGFATFLHALSNFLVSLPDELPGNPHTLGELLNSPAGSPLNYIALLIFPSLLYVVGGFWLLTSLILSRRNMEVRTVANPGNSFVMVR